jgi:hypothetical protein
MLGKVDAQLIHGSNRQRVYLCWFRSRRLHLNIRTKEITAQPFGQL